MKICHIVWGLKFGGIETMLVNIANAQVQEGATVYVIIINDYYEEALVKAFSDKVNLVFLNRKRHSRGLGFVIRFNRALHRIHPDAIHLHGSKIYGMIFSRRLSREASVTLHDLPTGSVRRGGILSRLFPIMNIGDSRGNVTLIDRVPKVFSISDAVKNELWNTYRVPSTVVYNGIRTADFSIRESFPCSKPLRIVQVGRLQHEKKGQDLLIRAIARLNGMAEVDFIGVGESMEYLRNLVSELSVENRVHFLGLQTQDCIARNLCKYDLFVQPSRYEGFGLTVAEAMAAQVPVLVSAGQGPAEVICGDKYGWLFENGNIDDLVRMIAHIRENYHKAQGKAVEARHHVVATYDVSVTAKKYLVEYGK